LNQPLGDEEIEWLESFLLDRFDEEADYLDVDEGVFSISELDGLLTAVVSGPVLVPPSQWLPAVWGDVEPQWQSEQQLQQVMSLSPGLPPGPGSLAIVVNKFARSTGKSFMAAQGRGVCTPERDCRSCPFLRGCQNTQPKSVHRASGCVRC
jgi:hypothetical protein